ncbi:M23 family metallopeptidase [Candidatus Gottesmanbacteria bacterium]|nr:M23 family metallopeptidase [Candidatus Gottesmanbacteria bacterium]
MADTPAPVTDVAQTAQAQDTEQIELSVAERFLSLAQLLAQNNPTYAADIDYFKGLLGRYGATRWSLEDVGFQRALRQFAKEFAQRLQQRESHPEELLEETVPLEVITRKHDQVAHYRQLHQRKFAEALARNYIKQLRTKGIGMGDEKEQEVLVVSVADTLKTTTGATSATELAQQAAAAIADSDLPNSLRSRAEEIRNVINTNETLVNTLFTETQTQQEIEEVLLQLPTQRPDIYAYIVTNLVAASSEADVRGVLPRAQELHATAETLVADFVPNKDAVAVNQFFRTFAKTGVQRAFAPMGDALVRFLGPETQWEVVETLLGRSVEKNLDPNALASHLGASADSSFYTSLRQEVGAERQMREATLESARANQSLKDRVGAKILKSSVAAFLFGQPDDLAKDVIELKDKGVFDYAAQTRGENISLSVARPTGQLYAPGRSAFHDALLHPHPDLAFLSSFWQRSDGLLALMRRKFPSSFFLRFLKDAGGWALIKGGVGQGIKGFFSIASRFALAKIGGAFLGTILIPIPVVGAIVGWLVTEVGSKLIGRIWGKIKGIFSSNWIFQSDRVLNDRDIIYFLLIFFIILIVPVLFFMMMVVAEFAVSGATLKKAGASIASVVRYAGSIPPNSSEITICPVASTITQTPFEPSTTHAHADAFDYADPAGTPVIAAHDGYVVGGCNRDPLLGNYVRLVGKNPDGTTYFTTYGHMLDGCSGAIAAASSGTSSSPTLITKGTTLGYVGSTGNSTGPHLHFQCDGSCTLETSKLPKSCGGSG